VRILIVDDSKAMRMIVARELRSARFSNLLIEEAASGVDGMTSVKNAPSSPSGRTGTCARVRTETIAEMRSAASEAGAVDLVKEPFTADHRRDALAPFA